MTRGRKICNTLKEIRQQIAVKNEIEYSTTDCHFEGDCQGTCPKCEAEQKYLENELHKRKLAGKAATVAGISLGLAGAFSACNAPQPQQTDTLTIPKLEMVADTVNLDTIPDLRIEDCFILEGEIITPGVIQPYFPDTIRKDSNDWVNLRLGEINPEKIVDMDMLDVIPAFPGGDEELRKFLQTNLIYPKEAKDKGIEGLVKVTFIVRKDGTITEVYAQKSPLKLLSAEAIRVVKMMPKWLPGKQNGKPVNVRFILPIEFKLND